MSVMTTVFWDVTPCSLVEVPMFRGTYLPHYMAPSEDDHNPNSSGTAKYKIMYFKKQ
jgi:hypothetical protein